MQHSALAITLQGWACIFVHCMNAAAASLADELLEPAAPGLVKLTMLACHVVQPVGQGVHGAAGNLLCLSAGAST